MKKHFLQTLLVVVLSVIGVSQCWADLKPFSYDSNRNGSCGIDDNNSIAYNSLNNSINVTTNTDGDALSIQIDNVHNGTLPAGSKSGFIALYKYDCLVKPYTKVVLTYDCQLGCYTSSRYVRASLYKFDDVEIAKSTKLDFTEGLTNQSGSQARFASVTNQTGSGWKFTSGTAKFEFDNLTGTSNKSISKYITLVFVEGQRNDATLAGVFTANLSCTNAQYAYTYRKIITFNGNGFTGGSMSQQTIDDSGNLTTNTFARDGYTFNGWNTEANGTGTTYADGEMITATATDKGPVTLYAQWKRTVTLDAQSGTVTPTSIEVKCHNTYSNLPTPTRTGYTFNGWFDAQTGGKQYTTTTPSTNDIPATLYAQWTAITYTITYNENGGSEIKEHLNYTIETETFALPVPEKDGYTFDGWFTDEACTQGPITQIDKGSIGNKTFYAKWTPITYNITYNVNDGSAITEHLTYTIETPTFALPVPTKNGYDFDGWFTNEACTQGQTTQIVKGSTTGNKTFYAKWNAITYNITYNVNDGSAITEHLTYTIETATFDLPVPTKDGYTFGGWFTNEACTEGQTTQIDKGSIGNKTFYAKWSENVVSDGSGKTLNEAQNEVNTALSTWVAECEGSKAINLTINRTIYKDGYYNTLCLPFDMSAAQIAATFGDYKELKQFQSATVQGSGASRSIVIEVAEATEIEAGKAYLISFENNGENLTTLTFNQVIVSTTKATNESGTLAYQGILAPYQLPYGDQDYLFLGEKNTLYWPINDGTFMKGFRAYFKVNTNPAQAPYRPGMRAAFGSRQTPTDLSPVVSGQEVRKLLEQGRVVIVNKGVKYNMNGATVQ